ncbi:MAG TPA: hypothetical protein VFZ84_02750 [Burkholderiales bacterium]
MRALLWMGLGAGAMYLLDPEQGRRRRALLREKMTEARRRIRSRAATASVSQTPEGAHHLGR